MSARPVAYGRTGEQKRFQTMLASRQRQQHRLLNTFGFGAHAFRLLIAAALALAVFALLLLADATGAMPGLLSPLHAIQVQSKPGDTPTPTTGEGVTPTSTVAGPPPSITLVSPSTAQGPVGAHVTIRGSNFASGSPGIFASEQADCSQSSGALPVNDNTSAGSFTATFVWPATYPVGVYYICTAGMSNSTAVYQVLSASPPALSLSTLTVQIGQPLTIQGTNFVGLPNNATAVTFTEAGGGQPPVTLPGNATVDSGGNFNVTWTVQGPTTGIVTIKAFADSEGGAPAVLQASATVTIQATATATATVATSPTAQATIAGGAGGTGSSNGSGGSIVLIIFLIIGILIAIGIIVGIVIYLTVRRRGPTAGQGQTPGYNDYNGYGGYGSYGDTTLQSPSQYPPGAPDGGFSGAGQFGWPQVGGQVSQWEDIDSQPGPDWQPRPMSGYYPSYNDSTPSQRGSSPFGQRSQPQSPVDPWNDPPPPPARYGSYPRGNSGYRGEPGPPNPDDDQWPDLDNNGYSGDPRGW
jgi:hypothetical protein